MPTVAFSHVALSVADLEVATAFYVDALGFEAGDRYSAAGRRVARLMEADPAGFDGVFLRLDGMLLELLAHHGAPRPAGSPRAAAEIGIAHLSFAVDDVGAAVARVVGAGGTAGPAMEQQFGGGGPTAIAFCLDPDGNRLEFVGHGDRAAVLAHAEFLGLHSLGWSAADAVLPGAGADRSRRQ